MLPKGEESARIQMLDQVHKHWIEGVLEGAVALGELQLAVASQPQAVLRHTDYGDYVLQPGISIQEVFDKVGGELLILGYPGSGKTVTLLQLARDLIKRAREDNTRPIPLIPAALDTLRITNGLLFPFRHLPYLLAPDA